ncbi:RloB family protein [Micromonospora craterilacus]|uniref:RloB family protein n=1 Tax=Micromonospora craterilacus TaxID=1655439 RepID=UPI001314CF44|nr:RloB family protein [Micromonospora craterilacus]
MQSRSSISLGQGRVTNLRRETGIREQRSAILIATNGDKTERDYLNALKKEPWVKPGKVVVVFESGSPEEVVKGAAKRRDRDDYDQAWAVCDVDHYATSAASILADATDVELLWSNPCFEVWLVLHKGNCTSYIEDGRRAADRLREHISDWDKTALRFDEFRDGVKDAVRRAKSLGEPPDANPSTAMWRLVEALSS